MGERTIEQIKRRLRSPDIDTRLDAQGELDDMVIAGRITEDEFKAIMQTARKYWRKNYG